MVNISFSIKCSSVIAVPEFGVPVKPAPAEEVILYLVIDKPVSSSSGNVYPMIKSLQVVAVLAATTGSGLIVTVTVKASPAQDPK